MKGQNKHFPTKVRNTMANGNEARAIPFPIHLAESSERPQFHNSGDDGSFWARRARDLRLTTMTQPVKPYWNTTMVTAWVAVIGLIIVMLGAIGSLYIYTRDTSIKIGDEQGYQRAKREELEAQIKEAKQDAAEAKKLQTYSAGVADTHNADKKPKSGKQQQTKTAE